MDRLKNGRTPFSYIPFALNDNPAAVAATLLTTGAIAIPSVINPPGILHEAAFVKSNGKLGFNSTGVGGDIINFEFVPSGPGPWPVQSYYTVGNYPTFGPASLTCYKVYTTFSLILRDADL